MDEILHTVPDISSVPSNPNNSNNTSNPSIIITEETEINSKEYQKALKQKQQQGKHAVEQATNFIELSSDITGLDMGRLFRGFKKSFDVINKAQTFTSRYTECREHETKPNKAFCTVASAGSTAVEHVAEVAGNTMIVEGAAMTVGGTILAPEGGVLAVASGVTVAGAGLCTVAKASEIGDAVFDFIMKQHPTMKEVITVNENNEYFKLNIQEKSIIPVSRSEAQLVINNSIDKDYQQHIMTLQTLSSEVANIRKDIDTISKTHVIDQQKPIESLKQVNETAELCYKNINSIFEANINYNNTVKDNASKPVVFSKRHQEYVDLVEEIKASPYERVNVQISGCGSKGGGFFVIIPVLAIPLGGGCTIL
jgi:hypothetical protein